MRVSHFALNLSDWDKPPELRKVWSINQDEVARIGQGALEQFSEDELTEIVRTVCWQGLAIQEFADVQDLTFPKAGPYFNINFFYFEGLTVLREGLLAGINGGVHASLAAFRAVLEMFALHCYWKQRRQEQDTYEEFYAWLRGTSKAPGFGKVLTRCYAQAPAGASTEDDAKSLYAKLCSYVHKPSLAESITSIRGSNQPGVSRELTKYWLQIVLDLQRHIVELLVRASPTALFPIDITRKFGFNPPVGLFFDHDSFRVLQKSLGKELTASYRARYQDNGEPPAEVQWALGRPDLTDARIFKSWHDAETPRLEGKSKAERIKRGRIMLKAKCRVVGQSLAYMMDTPEMPDIREIIASLNVGADESPPGADAASDKDSK